MIVNLSVYEYVNDSDTVLVDFYTWVGLRHWRQLTISRRQFTEVKDNTALLETWQTRRKQTLTLLLVVYHGTNINLYSNFNIIKSIVLFCWDLQHCSRYLTLLTDYITVILKRAVLIKYNFVVLTFVWIEVNGSKFLHVQIRHRFSIFIWICH